MLVKPTVASSAALALVLLAASPVLTGCFQGLGATTTLQASAAPGNGAQGQVGELKAQNLLLVDDPAHPGTLSLVGRLVNIGSTPDDLTGAGIGSAIASNATIGGGLKTILPGQSISIGFLSPYTITATGQNAALSSYVPVTLTFATAGTLTVQVLTVPPTIGEATGPALPAAAPSASMGSGALASPAAS